MKSLGLVLLLLITNSVAEPIKLATEPSVSFELLSRELDPIVSYLNRTHYPADFVRIASPDDLFLKCKNKEVNLVYMGSGIATLLIKHFDFIPLLTSFERTQLAIISKKGSNYKILKSNPNTSVYFVNHDLYSQYWAQSLNAKAKMMGFRTTERVIFSVLKNKESLGVTFVEDLGLVMDELSKTLSVHETMGFGKIMLLASPILINRYPELQAKLLAFHENWKDPNHKYHYLNVFHFRKWQEKDKKDMYVSDDFQAFLTTVKVK